MPYDLALPLLGIHPEELKAGSQREICTLMFIPALFTVAKIWKQSTFSLTHRFKKCEMKYYSALSQGNPVISIIMDGPKRYYAQWNKSVMEGQIMHDST